MFYYISVHHHRARRGWQIQFEEHHIKYRFRLGIAWSLDCGLRFFAHVHQGKGCGEKEEVSSTDVVLNLQTFLARISLRKLITSALNMVVVVAAAIVVGYSCTMHFMHIDALWNRSQHFRLID